MKHFCKVNVGAPVSRMASTNTPLTLTLIVNTPCVIKIEW